MTLFLLFKKSLRLTRNLSSILNSQNRTLISLAEWRCTWSPMNHGWHGEVIMNWNVRLLRHTLGCWWRINKLAACWTNIPREAYSITCIFEWKFGSEWSIGFKGVGNSKWGTLPFCYLPYGLFQLTSQMHYPQYKTGSPCGKKPHCWFSDKCQIFYWGSQISSNDIITMAFSLLILVWKLSFMP